MRLEMKSFACFRRRQCSERVFRLVELDKLSVKLKGASGSFVS